jgi:DNA-binding GntR family transcriptional regulator
MAGCRGRGQVAEDAAFMAADTAFHLELARTSGNPLIAESIERMPVQFAPAPSVAGVRALA